MEATAFRYASGGGGGGYYGGGVSYDDSTTDKVNQSTSGSTKTRHAGNGYVRITKI